ncbi:MAG: DUF3108 domain-containing protein [Bacteroidales bacterium]|nr:DUF3108 domain-containing protein [Bacteroidales bacterium]
MQLLKILYVGIILVSVMIPVNAQKKWESKVYNSYKAGEVLTYSMRYGPIHGGDAVLTLTQTVFKNKEVYHAKVLAKTVGITDKIFNVKDIYESVFDPVSGLPYKSVRDIREGGYTYYNEVYFYHSEKKVFSKKSGYFEVPEDILDMVSSLYYIRDLDFSKIKKGDVIEVVTFFGDEIFPFVLRFNGTETIKTSLGKFVCYRIDPVVETGRVFKSEDDMTMWFTADENLVPIRVKFNLIVGSVKCDLEKYENLKFNLQKVDN